jgi:hypothetical protein
VETIKLSCRCGQHIEVNRNTIGQRFNCPVCNFLITVPNVPLPPAAIAENQSDLELIKSRFKQTILLSLLIFICGVVVAVAGIGLHRRPMSYVGLALALIGFGGLLWVRFQIRQIHLQNEERRKFYQKYGKRG